MRLRSSIAVTLSGLPLGEAGLAAPQPQAPWGGWVLCSEGVANPGHAEFPQLRELGSAASVMLLRQALRVKGYGSPGPLWP